MPQQKRTDPESRPEVALRSQEAYTGQWGRTRLEPVHFALPSGALALVRVHTVVNATTDPALAERFLRGELNWVQPVGLDALEQVALPVVYHDETLPLFALVLPESFRARELAERRELLSRLEEDRGAPLPEYVRNFRVVYGPSGLADLLAAVAEEPSVFQEASTDGELAEREAEIVAREAALADWEDRLAEREQQLQWLQAELLDREAALQRRASPERTPAGGVGGAAGDGATRVTERAARDRTAEQAAAASAGDRLAVDDPTGVDVALGEAPLRDADGEVSDTSLEAMSEPKTRAADPADGTASRGGASRKKSEETPLAQALLQATEQSGATLDEEDAWREPAEAVADVAAAEDAPEGTGSSPLSAGAPEAAETEPDGAGAPGDALPEALRGWIGQEEPEPLWYLEDGRLHLGVSLHPEEAESFIGIEPVALLQVHVLPTYPLVTLGLLAGDRMGDPEAASYAVFWPFDVADASDLEVLDLLARDFRLVLSIYDSQLEAVTQQELHFPLEENARIVRERALALLEDMPVDDRDPDVALRAFGRPDYPKFAHEPLPFTSTDFQALETADEVAAAAATVAAWSRPEAEDELLLLRSFPAAGWRALRQRVLRAAIELGVWLEPALRRIALDAGFATSRRDLLRATLAGFEQAVEGNRLGAATPEWVCENWEAMLQEAERLGVVVEPRWEALAAEAQAALSQVGPVDSPGASSVAASGSRVLDEDAELLTAEDGHTHAEAGRQLTEPLEQLDESDLLEAEDLVEHEAALPPDGTPDAVSEDGPREDRPVLARDAQRSAASDDDIEVVDAEDLIVEDAEAPAFESGEPRGGEGTGDAGMSAEELRALSLPELVVLLGDERARAGALRELATRGDPRALPEMFSVLDAMEPAALVETLPALAAFGEEAEPYFITALRSGNTVLRLGSAAVLGCRRSERAEEGLLDLLLDEPTDQWTVVAEAVAALGEPMVMALASRVSHAGEAQRRRIAETLARVALRGACRGALVGLSRSQDREAAAAASDALGRYAELSLEEDGASEPPSDPVACVQERLRRLIPPVD